MVGLPPGYGEQPPEPMLDDPDGIRSVLSFPAALAVAGGVYWMSDDFGAAMYAGIVGWVLSMVVFGIWYWRRLTAERSGTQ